MRFRSRRTLTLAIALLAGIALATATIALWRIARPLAAITAESPTVRDAGWLRLLSHVESDRDLDRLLPRIEALLSEAPDAALADGAARLRDLGRWGWAHQPADLVFRELLVRARSDYEGDWWFALGDLGHCPLDEDPAKVMAVVNAVLESAREVVAQPGDTPPSDSRLDERYRVVWTALSWIGPWRPRLLDMIDLAPEDPADLHRAIEDARIWMEIASTLDAADVAEWIDPIEEDTWRALAADARLALPDRREAAWQASTVPRDTIDALLEGPIADADGCVYRVVLLAERHLERDVAVDLAAAWIRDFDDDRKRAGVMLSVLLGEHRDLLARSSEIEDVPDVRRMQTLGVQALTGRADPSGLGYFGRGDRRRIHGWIDPDVLVCLLAAPGNSTARLQLAQFISDEPPLPTTSIHRWHVRRFLPSWWALQHRAEELDASEADALPDLMILR
ncbi:MAG: hypothetical protein ACYTGG_12355, partial [Planctomycetota bacterium]